LEGLAELDIRTAIPSAGELAEYQALVVVARSPSLEGFTADQITLATTRPDGRKLPNLWLTSRKPPTPPPNGDAPTAIPWPVSVESLALFIQQL
jgi:hypothetical protein